MKLLISLLVFSLIAPAAIADTCETSVFQYDTWIGRSAESHYNDVSSMDECHDATFVVGDNYCQELRAGRYLENRWYGANPAKLSYGINGESRDWNFWCEGIPRTNCSPFGCFQY